MEVGVARVKSAVASVETARLNLEYCSICSPINGRAGQRLVDNGNVVTAASMGPATPLLMIERLDPIYADFTITENDLLSVQRSMQQGTVKTEVSLPDEPQRVRSGDLAFVDNAVQDGTGTVKLRATLANADHYFWPGRFVKVRLVLCTLKGARAHSLGRSAGIGQRPLRVCGGGRFDRGHSPRDARATAG